MMRRNLLPRTRGRRFLTFGGGGEVRTRHYKAVCVPSAGACQEITYPTEYQKFRRPWFLLSYLRPLFAESKVGVNKSVLYPPILTPPHLPTSSLSFLEKIVLPYKNGEVARQR